MKREICNTYFDVCAYNDGVNCEERNRCFNCGFRPAVHARRVKQIRRKMLVEALKKECFEEG